MAEMTEWTEETTPMVKPPERPVCLVGMFGHQWVLLIEEGQATVVLAQNEVCPTVAPRYALPGEGELIGVCEDDFQGFEPEDLMMEVGLPVRLTHGTDCPGEGAYQVGSHYIDHNDGGICDCNHWLEIVPAGQCGVPIFFADPDDDGCGPPSRPSCLPARSIICNKPVGHAGEHVWTAS
ncbi:MAG TPA: hypothetical protein VMZ50_02125 [Phycisphaerae bacterium]|nr:hypothetical protein [Phycisphaerae bacterium]